MAPAAQTLLEARMPPLDESKHKKDGPKGAPAWMVTYADMVTLLMCFFVVLLSFANMDVTKFREMMGSIRDALGVQRDDAGFFAPRVPPTPKLVLDTELEQLYSEMGASFETALDDYGLGDSIEVETSGEGVMLRLEGSLIYQPGSASMNDEALAVLGRLAEMMSDVYLEDMMLMVEGHTDAAQISGDRYPSNWELSSARAAGALRTLLDLGVPDSQVVALGFAASRPLATNDTPEGRARNRRVEFRMVVTPDEADVIQRTLPSVAGD